MGRHLFLKGLLTRTPLHNQPPDPSRLTFFNRQKRAVLVGGPQGTVAAGSELRLMILISEAVP